MWHAWGVFLVLYLLVTVMTLIDRPQAAANFSRHPWAAVGCLLFAGIGMPFVLAYTGIVTWTFRGKVKMEEEGS